jgi:hypothetical protein
MMKKYISLFSVALILLGTCDFAQAEGKADSNIVEYLKKSKFQKPLYELAFCLGEVRFILQTDSVYSKMWKQNIEDRFKYEKNLLQKMEFDFFMTKAIRFDTIFQMQANHHLIYNIKKDAYAAAFRNYIEYPDQLDDAWHITFLCINDCDVFEIMMRDDIVRNHYGNWIEYGYIEFRDSDNPAKNKINTRILQYLREKQKCQNKIVQNAFLMMENAHKAHVH